jgi:hypothetical protein
MWLEAGSDVTLIIDYMVDGVPVIPDSAAFVVRDHGGLTVHSALLPAMTNSEALTVPAVYNSLVVGTVFENRFVLVSFLHEGATYQQRLSYRLHTFIPLTATAQSVRSELGLDPSELADADVDLVGAYVTLAASVGQSFINAFVSLGTTSLAANQAVVLQAALNVADSLALRTGASVRSEDHVFTRFDKIDFQALRNNLETKLAKTLDQAVAAVVSVGFNSNLFVLSQPTDVITGQ